MDAKQIHCLTQWLTLEVRGPDAVDLLNRLLTLNLKLLEIGGGDFAFLLDHRGRVQHAFWLIRRAEDVIYLVSETQVSSLQEALDLFIFSERVTLTPLMSTCIYHRGPKTPNGARVNVYGGEDETLEWIEEGELQARCQSLLDAGSHPITVDELEAQRIIWGSHSPHKDYQDARSPLDLSTRGITEGKGCYPGQEVIERTLALGQPAAVTLHVQSELTPELYPLLQTLVTKNETLPVYLINPSIDKSAVSSPQEVGRLSSYTLTSSHHLYGVITIKRSASTATQWSLMIEATPLPLHPVVSNS